MGDVQHFADDVIARSVRHGRTVFAERRLTPSAGGASLAGLRSHVVVCRPDEAAASGNNVYAIVPIVF